MPSPVILAYKTVAGCALRANLEGFGHVFDDHFTHPDVVQVFQHILEFLHDHLAE